MCVYVCTCVCGGGMCLCVCVRVNACEWVYEGGIMHGVITHLCVYVWTLSHVCKRTQNCYFYVLYPSLYRQVSLVTFATYVLVFPGVALDASTAFVALSLINILNYPMALLPIGVTNIVQVSVN